MSLSPTPYKNTKDTNESGYLRVTPQAMKTTSGPSYRDIYNYIDENSDQSLDNLSHQCQVDFGCTKEMFSQAIQAYIISSN